MKIVWIILSSLATLVGAAFSLMMFSFIVLGAGNSKPEDGSMIRRWMIGIGASGAVCLIGGVWLLIAGRPGLAAMVGGFPVVLFVILLIFGK